MNRELMEKIAKRVVEDPNYPYGNKLGKGHSVKSALKTAVPLSSIGAALGGLSAAPVWIDDASQKKTKDKLLFSGIGTGIGAAIAGATGAKVGYDAGQNRRYLSYLPSNEQLKLSQSLSKLEASDNKIRTRNENVEIDDDEACALYIQNTKKRDKLLGDAYARGKAFMLAQKKNSRLFKKASDYLDDAVMEKQASTAFSRYIAKNSDKVLAYVTKRDALNEGQEAIRYMIKEKELTKQPFGELSIKDKNLRKIWGRFRKSYEKDIVDNITKHNKVSSLETIKDRAAYRKSVLDKYKGL